MMLGSYVPAAVAAAAALLIPLCYSSWVGCCSPIYIPRCSKSRHVRRSAELGAIPTEPEVANCDSCSWCSCTLERSRVLSPSPKIKRVFASQNQTGMIIDRIDNHKRAKPRSTVCSYSKVPVKNNLRLSLDYMDTRTGIRCTNASQPRRKRSNGGKARETRSCVVHARMVVFPPDQARMHNV